MVAGLLENRTQYLPRTRQKCKPLASSNVNASRVTLSSENNDTNVASESINNYVLRFRHIPILPSVLVQGSSSTEMSLERMSSSFNTQKIHGYIRGGGDILNLLPELANANNI
jgi:hypothetical protein